MKRYFLPMIALFIFVGCNKKDNNVYASSKNTIYDYTINNGKVTINGFNDNYKNQTSIIIPYSIDKYEVDVIKENAFLDNTRIVNIDFSSSTLTTIENSAFSGCYSLTNITLPNSVTSLGEKAFQNCKGLENISLVNTKISSLKSNAFDGCISLSTISLPNSLNILENKVFNKCLSITSLDFSKTGITSIPDEAFMDLSLATSILLPSTVKSIGDNAFLNDEKLVSMDLSETNIKSIGDTAFKNCISLSSVKLPNSLENIGIACFEKCIKIKSIDFSKTHLMEISQQCFQYCSKLEEVKLPDSLSKIDEKAFMRSGLIRIDISENVSIIASLAFSDCDALTEIKVSLDNTKYSDDNGVLYSKDKKTLIHYPASRAYSKYEVLEGTTTIMESSFKKCVSLAEIDLSKTKITEIKERTFSQCLVLNKVVLNDDITKIGSYAFYNCIGLLEFTGNKELITIDDNAFYECVNLAKLNLLKTKINTIGLNAFYKCEKLKTIYFPGTLYIMEKGSFSFCALTKINYTSTITNWQEVVSRSSECGINFNQEDLVAVEYLED